MKKGGGSTRPFFSKKNTGATRLCHFQSQGVFPTQGLGPAFRIGAWPGGLRTSGGGGCGWCFVNTSRLVSFSQAMVLLLPAGPHYSTWRQLRAYWLGLSSDWQSFLEESSFHQGFRVSSWSQSLTRLSANCLRHDFDMLTHSGRFWAIGDIKHKYVLCGVSS